MLCNNFLSTLRIEIRVNIDRIYLKDLFPERFQQILEYQGGDSPLAFSNRIIVRRCNSQARESVTYTSSLPFALFPSPCDPLYTLFRRNGEFN